MAAETSSVVRIALGHLTYFTAHLFEAVGVPRPFSETVAMALVAADMEGQPSHGVMLVPMYIDRIRAGSVSLKTQARVVSDRGSAIVLDAENALGQLSSPQAVEILRERVPEHGIAMVTIRNGFHFGTAGHWAQLLAERGFIGVVMSNTRPLMPAPGGAERVVGNNPLAIAMPTEAGPPLVLDMAMSASAMGKIRLAEAAGASIPEGWATDSSGRPTTDPAEAIKGMLLPAAGPKGFGLALMIDLFCGGLSTGAIGDEVRPLYGKASDPYLCAHCFIGIDVMHFCDLEQFKRRASGLAERVRHSKRAPGVERVFAPGEPGWSVRQENGDICPLAPDTVRQLKDLADKLGVSSESVFMNTR
jgi:LDH2 family malate/lactate/ureidoglycolate dehydrogenase